MSTSKTMSVLIHTESIIVASCFFQSTFRQCFLIFGVFILELERMERLHFRCLSFEVMPEQFNYFSIMEPTSTTSIASVYFCLYLVVVVVVVFWG